MSRYYLNTEIGSDIWTSESKTKGITIGIFAGIHGDEKAGVQVLDLLKENIFPNRGCIHLVLANQKAVLEGKRFLNKNLNRCFYDDNYEQEYEDEKARELMKLMDKCDVVIDLHEHKDETNSIIICEHPSFELAKKLNGQYVLYNLCNIEPNATDTYMFRKNKIGICFEAGNIKTTESNIQTHFNAVKIILKELEIVDSIDIKTQQHEKTFIKVSDIIIKSSSTFSLNRNLKCFDSIEDISYATCGNKDYLGKKNEVIIFPRPDNAVGTSVGLIGKKVKEWNLV